MDEKKYWLAFSAFPGVGPHTFKKLLDGFGSAKAAWGASKDELIAKAIEQSISTKLVQFRSEFDIENYLKRLEKLQIQTILSKDEDYPNLLKEIPNPPFVLYVRGKFGFNANELFGIVGTRKITEYGKTVTDMFAAELANEGFTIVSGLAMGVDSQSHLSTVQNSGKTIAVLGCGVDCCTPPSNQWLYDKILEHNGAIISEVPPGYLPTKGSFPSRNRIIAGMSKALLVTEGAEDSGSLITAECALKFGRPVFAVPGPITSSLSKGPYSLIEKGATLVTDPQQIIEELGIKNYELGTIKIKSSKFKNGTRDEQKILELLENEQVHFNDLVRLSKIKTSKLSSLLSIMEVKGMVKSGDGGLFSVSIKD